MQLLARILSKVLKIGPNSGALVRVLNENLRVFAPYYVVAFIAMSAESSLTGFAAWLLKDIIDKVFVSKSLYYLYYFAALIVAVYAVKGTASYISTFCTAKAGNGVIARVQERLFESLVRQDADFFNRFSSGDLIMRSTTMAQVARSILDVVVGGIGRDGTTLVSLIVVMLLQNWMMTTVALLTAPLAIFGVRILLRQVHALARQEMSSAARVVTYIQEMVHGIRIVKAFSLERRLQGDVDRMISDVELRANKIVQLNAMTSPLMEFLAGIAIALVVAFGGFQVAYFDQTPGSFFSFITALLLAYEPAKRIANMNASLTQSLVGLQGMYELIDARPAITDQEGAEDFAAGQIDVALENVSFSYREETAVLSGVTLLARSGTVTALVGPSGAGKSTVFSLLERFYDVSEGAITFNGTDIRQLTLKSLRRHLAFVTQDTFLFEGTIASNIADGNQQATREQIEAAARDANAYDFIMAMPEGFETRINGGGGSLSGGQRQRISIARAMLRHAPVLLLDEATSALDAKAEAEVQEALSRLMIGRTTLVIAHRLSTVRNADCICVLDQGRLVQSGTHEELLAQGGLYAHLHALQFRDKPQAEANTHAELQVSTPLH